MKQHIRSQFLIKRFSDKQNKMNIFNLKDGIVSFDKKSEKIFYEDDIYPLNIEDGLNKQLENKMALLLDNKIINKTEICLTREDLLLIKKFLIIESIRTYTPDQFLVIIKGFSKNALETEKIYDLLDPMSSKQSKKLPSINEINLSAQEIYNNTLEVCINMHDIDDLLSDKWIKLANKEIYYWIKAFYAQYLVFLDANDEQDFIFSDNGMTSEYELSRYLIKNCDLSKVSYLTYQIEKAAKENNNLPLRYYASFLKNMKLVFENFSIFNLSFKRSIALVNPFFKLYTKEITDKGLKKPDIWPSGISENDILIQPTVKYKVSNSCSPNDEFFYKPKKLSLEDTIYINFLFLYATHNTFGFVNFEKIKDSFYNYETVMYLDVITTPINEWDKIQNKIMLNILNNKMPILIEKYKDKVNVTPTIEPFWLARHLKKVTDNDVNNNYYLLNYLLSHKDLVVQSIDFSIFGVPNERIKNIELMIKKIKGYEHE